MANLNGYKLLYKSYKKAVESLPLLFKLMQNMSAIKFILI